MNNCLSVNEVKRPLKIGEVLLVTCLVKRNMNSGRIISFTPIIDNPHSDIENGQPEIHYHADYRFILTEETKENGQGFIVIDEREGFNLSKPRVEEGIDGEKEVHALPVVSEEHKAIAQLLFIRNSKLKHKCIQKGKCPHRGHDLTQERAINGIITCPLHGLEFDEKTGYMTNENVEQLEKFKKLEIKHKEKIQKLHNELNKIKDGDTISLEKYKEIMDIGVCIFNTTETRNEKGFDCVLTICLTDDFITKKEIKGRTYTFKVKE